MQSQALIKRCAFYFFLSSRFSLSLFFDRSGVLAIQETFRVQNQPTLCKTKSKDTHRPLSSCRVFTPVVFIKTAVASCLLLCTHMRPPRALPVRCPCIPATWEGDKTYQRKNLPSPAKKAPRCLKIYVHNFSSFRPSPTTQQQHRRKRISRQAPPRDLMQGETACLACDVAHQPAQPTHATLPPSPSPTAAPRRWPPASRFCSDCHSRRLRPSSSW